ncbi:unnamed protein product [Alopecurus aequalis]
MVAQRIRVSFSDPDATDSDSGDESSRHVPRAMRAEMVILVAACTNGRSPTTHATSTVIKSSAGPPPQLPRMRGVAKVARSAPSRRFRGVYERQPGRWAADFRSHRPKVRQWLGTFQSEEEAKAAYDAYAAKVSLAASSVDAVTLSSPTATRSTVQDGSEQSEIGLDHQADALSTVSSAPCMSSLTSSPPAADVTSHEPLPDAVEERQIKDLYLAEHLADEDSIGLADLADLPIPSLDDSLDFGSGDWSILDIGFR